MNEVASPNAPLILLQRLVKSYDGAPVLNGIDLVVESGARCFLAGPAGSGKTTLLGIIGGLARPTAGSVFLDGEEVRRCGSLRPTMVSSAFQMPVFFPELTVLENLLLPALRCGDSSISDRGEQLLDAFGLAEMFDLFPAALSGGERQRLNLARALFFTPRLLLLDEPTACLDTAWREKIMELVMREVRDARSTLVIATNNPLPTEGFRSVRMQRGKVIENGNSDN